MKKLILLLGLLFIVSGCSSDYFTQKKFEDKGYYCNNNSCVYENTTTTNYDDDGTYLYTSTTSKFNFENKYYYYLFCNIGAENYQAVFIDKWEYTYYYETGVEKATVFPDGIDYNQYDCSSGTLNIYDSSILGSDELLATVDCNSIWDDNSEYQQECESAEEACVNGRSQYEYEKVD